jgi:2'-hydroxyisoflavone reductase
MRTLVLGGTAWLGREIAREGLRAGHEVTCLARGTAGAVADGARLIVADRDSTSGDALAAVAAEAWDLVVDVTRQPGQARRAVRQLGPHARCWVYVSSLSVVADTQTPHQDEIAPTVEPLQADVAAAADYAAGKRACELAVLDALGPARCLIARAGLIGGPGDHTGRTGYWPLRFARPAGADGAVLVPEDESLPTQVIDARDLAAWLVAAGAAGTNGIFNACGDVIAFGEHLRVARAAGAGRRINGAPAAHAMSASPAWLVEHDVQPWSGPRSLPLWLPRPSHDGFAAHRNAAAKAAGLRLRPLVETLADTLAWELDAALPAGPRMAGLNADEERELLNVLAAQR